MRSNSGAEIVARNNLIKNGPSLQDFISLSAAKNNKSDDMRAEFNNIPISSLKLKVYIETYGCQMNVSDSEIVISVLQSAGHQRVNSINEAEVLLTNTCAVRENAGSTTRYMAFLHLKWSACKRIKCIIDLNSSSPYGGKRD